MLLVECGVLEKVQNIGDLLSVVASMLSLFANAAEQLVAPTVDTKTNSVQQFFSGCCTMPWAWAV